MSSRAPAHSLSFEIKSASLPLVSFVMKSADITQVAQDLQTRLGDTPDFFDNDPVLVDLQHLEDQAGPLDLPALVQLLRSFRMNPVALRPNNAANEAAAILAGLFLTTEARTLPQNPATQEVVREVEVIREVLGESTAITGFYSYGDISFSQRDAKSEFNNQSMTITTMLEKK